MLFNLGTALPSEEVAALPSADSNGEITTGTRVITLEAYYDATIDPAFGWSDLLAVEAPWNSDPTKGYKLDLGLLDYSAASTGSDGSWVYYTNYSEYITEPNKWVTITFETKDTERFGAPGITSDKVTGFALRPTPGYDGSGNKLYLRNLKIVNVN